MVGITVGPGTSGECAVRITAILTVVLEQEGFVEHLRAVIFQTAYAVNKVLVYDNLVEEVPATAIDI